ncbi:protein-tyrosine phosphatase family protein [Prauserella muralis]|uniref:Protein tyrosine phosphatase n=1 Tax=Prauserella muralis TaxID=588067 RepID=A0A2V4B862_9PSEU|nr:protein-tyrosine phosphatase family protein [Prauserella muralis]PXY31544.1 protein tyrosine phosphatase [Prauserella muralis]TWE14106.1 protein-tyrosine phosphatase [Prauserella muralis]
MTDAALPGAIELPDGTWVRGRGLRRPDPGEPRPDFGLYLGAAILHRRHEPSLDWPHEWVHWPDGWVPSDWEAAADAIVRLRERARAGERVELACHGGVGRTGTALACLVTLAGLPPRDALRWARRNYHRHAAELPWQRAWVAWFARRQRLGRRL